MSSSNLRYVPFKYLIQIRENNYEALTLPGKKYDKDEVEAEIKRKLESKIYKERADVQVHKEETSN